MTHLAQFLDVLAPLSGCLEIQKMEEVDVRVLSFGLKGGVWERSLGDPNPNARNRGCLTLLDAYTGKMVYYSNHNIGKSLAMTTNLLGRLIGSVLLRGESG